MSAVAMVIALMKAEKGERGLTGKTGSTSNIGDTSNIGGTGLEISLMSPLSFVEDTTKISDVSPDMFTITADGKYLTCRGFLVTKIALNQYEDSLIGTLSTPLTNSMGVKGVVFYQLQHDNGSNAFHIRIVGDKVWLTLNGLLAAPTGGTLLIGGIIAPAPAGTRLSGSVLAPVMYDNLAVTCNSGECV
jgi:hypothetical protein